MNKIKTQSQSKTIQAIVVGILSILTMVGGYLGHEFNYTTDQAEDIAVGIGSVVGLLAMMAAWKGRKNADSEIVSSQEYENRTGGPMPLVLLFLLMPVMAGCMTRAEHATAREGWIRATDQIRSEHRSWAQSLATDPKTLPNLFDGELPADRDAWLRTRLGWHEDFETTTEAVRSNDLR